MASSGSSGSGQKDVGRDRLVSSQSDKEWSALQSDLRAAVNEPFSNSSSQAQTSQQPEDVFSENMGSGSCGEEDMGQHGKDFMEKSPDGGALTVRSREELHALYKNREERRERLEHSGVLDLLTKVLVRTHLSEGSPQSLEAFRGTIAHSLKFNPIKYELEALAKEKAEIEEKIAERKERITRLKEQIREQEEKGVKANFTS